MFCNKENPTEPKATEHADINFMSPPPIFNEEPLHESNPTKKYGNPVKASPSEDWLMFKSIIPTPKIKQQIVSGIILFFMSQKAAIKSKSINVKFLTNRIIGSYFPCPMISFNFCIIAGRRLLFMRVYSPPSNKPPRTRDIKIVMATLTVPSPDLSESIVRTFFNLF